MEVAEAAQAVNKGGTARNRPLPIDIGRGFFYAHADTEDYATEVARRAGENFPCSIVKHAQYVQDGFGMEEK